MSTGAQQVVTHAEQKEPNVTSVSTSSVSSVEAKYDLPYARSHLPPEVFGYLDDIVTKINKARAASSTPLLNPDDLAGIVRLLVNAEEACKSTEDIKTFLHKANQSEEKNREVKSELKLSDSFISSERLAEVTTNKRSRYFVIQDDKDDKNDVRLLLNLADDDVVVQIGDLHGDLYRLIEILLKVGFFSDSKIRIIFTGDAVDRGHESLRTQLLLARLRHSFPNRVTLVAGNHELSWASINQKTVGMFAILQDIIRLTGDDKITPEDLEEINTQSRRLFLTAVGCRRSSRTVQFTHSGVVAADVSATDAAWISSINNKGHGIESPEQKLAKMGETKIDDLFFGHDPFVSRHHESKTGSTLTAIHSTGGYSPTTASVFQPLTPCIGVLLPNGRTLAVDLTKLNSTGDILSVANSRDAQQKLGPTTTPEQENATIFASELSGADSELQKAYRAVVSHRAANASLSAMLRLLSQIDAFASSGQGSREDFQTAITSLKNLLNERGKDTSIELLIRRILRQRYFVRLQYDIVPVFKELCASPLQQAALLQRYTREAEEEYSALASAFHCSGELNAQFLTDRADTIVLIARHRIKSQTATDFSSVANLLETTANEFADGLKLFPAGSKERANLFATELDCIYAVYANCLTQNLSEAQLITIWRQIEAALRLAINNNVSGIGSNQQELINAYFSYFDKHGKFCKRVMEYAEQRHYFTLIASVEKDFADTVFGIYDANKQLVTPNDAMPKEKLDKLQKCFADNMQNRHSAFVSAAEIKIDQVVSLTELNQLYGSSEFIPAQRVANRALKLVEISLDREIAECFDANIESFQRSIDVRIKPLHIYEELGVSVKYGSYKDCISAAIDKAAKEKIKQASQRKFLEIIKTIDIQTADFRQVLAYLVENIGCFRASDYFNPRELERMILLSCDKLEELIVARFPSAGFTYGDLVTAANGLASEPAIQSRILQALTRAMTNKISALLKVSQDALMPQADSFAPALKVTPTTEQHQYSHKPEFATTLACHCFLAIQGRSNVSREFIKQAIKTNHFFKDKQSIGENLNGNEICTIIESICQAGERKLSDDDKAIVADLLDSHWFRRDYFKALTDEQLVRLYNLKHPVVNCCILENDKLHEKVRVALTKHCLAANMRNSSTFTAQEFFVPTHIKLLANPLWCQIGNENLLVQFYLKFLRLLTTHWYEGNTISNLPEVLTATQTILSNGRFRALVTAGVLQSEEMQVVARSARMLAEVMQNGARCRDDHKPNELQQQIAVFFNTPENSIYRKILFHRSCGISEYQVRDPLFAPICAGQISCFDDPTNISSATRSDNRIYDNKIVYNGKEIKAGESLDGRQIVQEKRAQLRAHFQQKVAAARNDKSEQERYTCILKGFESIDEEQLHGFSTAASVDWTSQYFIQADTTTADLSWNNDGNLLVKVKNRVVMQQGAERVPLTTEERSFVISVKDGKPVYTFLETHSIALSPLGKQFIPQYDHDTVVRLDILRGLSPIKEFEEFAAVLPPALAAKARDYCMINRFLAIACYPDCFAQTNIMQRLATLKRSTNLLSLLDELDKVAKINTLPSDVLEKLRKYAQAVGQTEAQIQQLEKQWNNESKEDQKVQQAQPEMQRVEVSISVQPSVSASTSAATSQQQELKQSEEAKAQPQKADVSHTERDGIKHFKFFAEMTEDEAKAFIDKFKEKHAKKSWRTHNTHIFDEHKNSISQVNALRMYAMQKFKEGGELTNTAKTLYEMTKQDGRATETLGKELAAAAAAAA